MVSSGTCPPRGVRSRADRDKTFALFAVCLFREANRPALSGNPGDGSPSWRPSPWVEIWKTFPLDPSPRFPWGSASIYPA